MGPDRFTIDNQSQDQNNQPDSRIRKRPKKNIAIKKANKIKDLEHRYFNNVSLVDMRST